MCSIVWSTFLWCTYLHGGDLQNDFLYAFINTGKCDRERTREQSTKVVDANLNAWGGLATMKWTD